MLYRLSYARSDMVGAAGLEPATSWSQTMRSDQLSYAPTAESNIPTATGPVNETRCRRLAACGDRGSRAACRSAISINAALLVGAAAEAAGRGCCSAGGCDTGGRHRGAFAHGSQGQTDRAVVLTYSAGCCAAPAFMRPVRPHSRSRTCPNRAGWCACCCAGGGRVAENDECQNWGTPRTRAWLLC